MLVLAKLGMAKGLDIRVQDRIRYQIHLRWTFLAQTEGWPLDTLTRFSLIMSCHLLLALGFGFSFPDSEATPVLEEVKRCAK